MRLSKTVLVYGVGMFVIPGVVMFLSGGGDEESLQKELQLRNATMSSGASRANRAGIAQLASPSAGRTPSNPDVVDKLLKGGRGSTRRLKLDDGEQQLARDGTGSASSGGAAAPSSASAAGTHDYVANRRAAMEQRIREIKAIDDYDERVELMTELQACRTALRDIENNEKIAAHARQRQEEAQQRRIQKKLKKKKKKKKQRRRERQKQTLEGEEEEEGDDDPLAAAASATPTPTPTPKPTTATN